MVGKGEGQGNNGAVHLLTLRETEELTDESRKQPEPEANRFVSGYEFSFFFIPPVIGASQFSGGTRGGQDRTQKTTGVWVHHKLDSSPGELAVSLRCQKHGHTGQSRGPWDGSCYLTRRCSTGPPRLLRERTSPPRHLCGPTPAGWSPH